MTDKKLTINNLDKILLKEKIKFQTFYKFYPKGIRSLCIFYFKNIDNDMIKNCKKKIRNEKSISKRVKIFLNEKFSLLHNNEVITTYFIDYLTINPKLFLHLCYQFSDLIWTQLKDKSTDFNFYTKRFILSIIYKNALYYWRNNKDLSSLSNYFDKKIEMTGKLGKIKKSLTSRFENINISNILSKFDFMYK